MELRKALADLSPEAKTTPKYFQALLQTTVENYVPGKASLVITIATEPIRAKSVHADQEQIFAVKEREGKHQEKSHAGDQFHRPVFI